MPHFTGIRATNQYEQRCIKDVWHKSDNEPHCLPLKPYFGHNLGGASILEAAVLAKMIQAQQLPGCDLPDSSKTDLPTGKSSDWRSAEINFAVKASAAFAGFYGAVVLGRCNAMSDKRNLADEQIIKKVNF